MSHRSFLVGAIVSVLLCSVSARSQESASGTGSDDSPKAVARKKAIELLGSVAGQVNGLHSAENRARIGSNVADLLWNHDERRARELFSAVAEDIRVEFSNTDPKDVVHRRTVMVFGQLRSETIDRIARHDPDLALNFLRATRLPPETQVSYGVNADTVEKSLELRLATQIAATNPQLALKLGRESLANGFSLDLVGVLSQLQRRDKEAGLSFYKEIVDRLKGANLMRDAAASWFAFNLAQSFQPPNADESVYRDLIGVVLAAALASGCANSQQLDVPPICFEIGSVFPKMEKYYALRAAQLKPWAEHADSLEDFPGWSSQINEAIEKGTVDELLALAPHYPQMQFEILRAAMKKAEASGDVNRARQIASDIPEEDQRHFLLAELERDQAWVSISAEKLATVQEEVGRLRSDEERVRFLLHVASRLGATDRKAALGLLNQAGQLIDSSRSGKAKIAGQISLALLYCSLNSNRGFAIMESLLPKLNEVVAAAATLDGIESSYLSDGEWNMTGEGVVGGLLTHLAQNVGFFAALDFDRSVSLASQLERPELRLMAHSKIAQAILAGQGKTATMVQSAAFDDR